MAAITLHEVEKVFPNGYVAARGLSLEVADGELLVLVGPSGSGKSTVLRMIAGLEEVTGGTIRIGGRDVTNLPPRDRDVAFVFQSYALYPHMSVRDNLGFGLKMRGVSTVEAASRIGEVAATLGLEALLDRRPAQLSGGQRQRVALGRAIAREPIAFLLDEPLSNLDARLRLEMRAELARLHRQLGVTMVYVTHDQTEAMTLGQRVAVLDDGVLHQIGPPLDLYDRPADTFVAEFLGAPGMNLVRGGVESTPAGRVFVGGGIRLPLPEETAPCPAEVILGIRPHQLEVAPAGGDADLEAEVSVVEPLGSEQIVHLTTRDGTPLVAATPPGTRLQAGTNVSLRMPPAALQFFRAADGRRLDEPSG